MKQIYLLFACLMLTAATAWGNIDSVGVKVMNHKTFIIHKVDKGEGLYGIARRYGVPVKKLQDANPKAKKGLEIGQNLMVPCDKPVSAPDTKTEKKTAAAKPEPKKEAVAARKVKPQPVEATSAEPDKAPIYHTVTKGETIFRIAQNHHMTADELKKMNRNFPKGLHTGQKIIVGYNNATATSENKPEEPKGKVAGCKGVTTNATASAESKYKTTRYGDQIDAKLYKEAQAITKNIDESKKDGKTVSREMQESGMGMSIDDGSVVSKKNMALHRSAPPGTIIKVTNPMNNKSVFVTVVAPLPQDASEENCIIKITKTAANTLGILDPAFRVDLRYSMEIVK